MSPLVCGFGDFPVRLDPASVRTAGLFAPSDFRQQQGRLDPGKPHRNGCLRVRKQRLPLPGASRDRCPDSFAPPVFTIALRRLSDRSVDHHEADRLFRQVIRQCHSQNRNEPEITLTMLVESGCHVAAVPYQQHIRCPTTPNLEPR